MQIQSNTTTITTRLPIPLRKLAEKAAARADMSLSRWTYLAVADAIAEEFGITTGDGLEAAQQLKDQAD